MYNTIQSSTPMNFPDAFNYHEEYHALSNQTATLSKTSKEQSLVQSSNLLGIGSYIKQQAMINEDQHKQDSPK